MISVICVGAIGSVVATNIIHCCVLIMLCHEQATEHRPRRRQQAGKIPRGRDLDEDSVRGYRAPWAIDIGYDFDVPCMHESMVFMAM